MSFEQFELEAQVQPHDVPSSKLFKWKSKRTGMQVVLIQRESPSVQAHLAVASEANDNFGCPHTLEHIVFMGSKQYPYKGFLDKVAVKQLSSINAFTEQDKTCYTLDSAGYEGFLNTLPIFLDNILHATVEDSACLTEVYHIDGKGEEKGVVFCEMQSYENTEDTVMVAEMQRLLYEPTSGYATNTGGMLSALRKLESSTIKQYHRDVYRPDNLSIVVSGSLEPQQLLSVIGKFDSELPESTKKHPRPFVDSKFTNAPSPLKENTYSLVEFPDSSEDSGQILIAWLGPGVKDTVADTALEVINMYLTMPDAGKLERKFIAVEKESALASHAYASVDSYLISAVNLWLTNVPSSLSSTAPQQIVDYLEKELLEELDMNLIKQSVTNLYDNFVLSAENSWQVLGNIAVMDFMYGDESTFVPWMAGTEEFEVLTKWTKDDWTKFIKEYVVAPPKACIFGRPSRELSNKIDKEKKQMRKEIKKTHDIKEAGRKLEEALRNNDKPVPDELLEKYRTPNFANIPFISTQHAPSAKLLEAVPNLRRQDNNELNEILRADSITGVAVNFEQIKSQFVSIDLYVTPQQISPHLYPLIPAVMNRIFAMPMELDDGTTLSAEDVITESKNDLLMTDFDVFGELRELATLTIRARVEKYEKAMEWIKRIFFNVIFDEENTAMALGRHLKGLADIKRSDEYLLDASMEGKLLSEESLRRNTDPLLSEADIVAFEQNIPETVKELQKLYKSLFQKENMRIQVRADFIAMSEKYGRDSIVTPWNSISERLGGSSGPILPVIQSSKFMTQEARNPPKEAYLTISAATDSTNMIVSSPGITTYRDEDLAGLAVVSAYLESLEGPLSDAVRGTGLAYGAFITASVQLGSVQCSIYESTDAIAAYDACKNVLEDITSGKIHISETDVTSSAATVICQLANVVATPAASAKSKFTDVVLKGYGVDRIENIIKKVSEITPTQFVDLLAKYFMPIFNVDTSMAFVVAPVSEEDSCRDALTRMGYKVTVKEAEFDDDDDGSSEEEDGSDEESEEDDSEGDSEDDSEDDSTEGSDSS